MNTQDNYEIAVEAKDEFKVRLTDDKFFGPMDLLLHLVREEELNVRDIPVARICADFAGYVDLIREIDINSAGDFIEMAARLIMIKSYVILPREEMPQIEEDDDDPRLLLVQQLLEYKKYKDRALMLGERYRTMRRRLERGMEPSRPDAADPVAAPDCPAPDESAPAGEKPSFSVTLWDLMSAFEVVLRETHSETARILHVDSDDRPVRWFIERLVGKIEAAGEILFTQLFDDARDRNELLGYFMAVLELMKLGKIHAQNVEGGPDIWIHLRHDAPTMEQILGAGTSFEVDDGAGADEADENVDGADGRASDKPEDSV